MRGTVIGYLRKALGVVAGAGFSLLAYVWITVPDVRPLKTTNPSTTAFMELRAEEARTSGKPVKHSQRWIAYNHISKDLQRAVLVAEDDAFWQHEGVDFEQLQESLQRDWAKGRFVRGGSTITQQLAKNLYLSPSKNPLRKLRELIIARRLEAALSKARIFEIYLNVIEWGDGIYGIEPAAQRYFGKPASELLPEEAAVLAAMIPNPRRYTPSQNLKYLEKRKAQILERLMRSKYLAPEEYQAAIVRPIAFR